MTGLIRRVLLVDGPRAGQLLDVQPSVRTIRMARPVPAAWMDVADYATPSVDDIIYQLTNPRWVQFVPDAQTAGAEHLAFADGLPQLAHSRLLITGEAWHDNQADITNYLTGTLVHDATTGQIEGGPAFGKLIGEPVVTVIDIDREAATSEHAMHLIPMIGQAMIELTVRCLIQPVLT